MASQIKSLLKYVIFVLILWTTTCFPIDKLNAIRSNLKDETFYPNGTVVGKYSYMDDKGNPIHVKYYADDSSYGVELKSVKVSTNPEESAWKSNNFDTMKPIESPLSMKSEFLTPINPVNKIMKYDTKIKEKKLTTMKSSDYETLYRNDIKTPRQCEKNKVRVYLDKEKKIIKRALDKVAKYCEQF